MIKQTITRMMRRAITLAALATVPAAASAQVPVDDSGQPIGSYEPTIEALDVGEYLGDENIPLLSDTELEDLVGPIALYPDDLLAIVLPASAYPLQLMEAARFLEEYDRDPSLKPDPDWDDSVVALLNYPEVIELLNEDMDWTWRLGEAVVGQQGDVVLAIESFRDRAYAAGNLKSDSYQNVTRNDGVIEISPVAEDVIYVPYYEPERVVVYQPRPVYYYYPRSYPVYYYPYSSAYDFNRGYFWGVTTAFTIGWLSDSLHVYHHSYHGHPYYGRYYGERWWYRRPSVDVYNTTYVRNTDVTINRYYSGDRWRPRHDRRDYTSNVYERNVRVTRNRDYKRSVTENRAPARTVRRQAPIEFRDRPERNSDAYQKRREQPRSTTTRLRQDRTEPVARQARQRYQPARPVREETRATTQRQARQQPRERATPQRQARQQPREPATPQSQARQQPRERATPQRRAQQQNHRAAPQRAEKRETRSTKGQSQKRSGDAGARKERKDRR